MKKHLGSITLWGFYFVVICLFGYLSIYQKDIRSILNINTYVSASMLAIVGIILFFAWFKYLRTGDKMISDLKHITDQLETEADGTLFLWKEYKQKDTLFHIAELQTSYNHYRQEMARLEIKTSNGYTCDIEDFINYDLIDSSMNKGFLNLIPGVMTGLGILGTFVGLSFGLQNFNTGTAEEIASSIAPLMNGIKVAFHTSIYGMIMSLAFNFVYKKKFEDAYRSTDEFILAWRRHVVPNANNEGMSRLLQYQEQLSNNISNLSEHVIDRMAQKLIDILVPQYEKISNTTEKILDTTTTLSQDVSRTLSDALVPEFNRLNETFSSFAEITSKSQVEGMNEMVDVFMNRLNGTLQDRFTRLAEVIDSTCEMQQQNSIFLKDTIEWITDTAKELQNINSDSQKTILALQEYTEKISFLQNKITEDIQLFDEYIKHNEETVEKSNTYNEKLHNYIKEIANATTSFVERMNAVTENTKQQMDLLTVTANEAIKHIEEQAFSAAKAIEQEAEENVTSIHQVQQEVIESNQMFVKELLKDADSYTVAVQRKVVEFTNNLTQELKEFSTDFIQEALHSTSQMRSDIVESADAVNQEIKDCMTAIKEMKNVMQKSNEEELQKLNKQMEEILKNLTSTVKKQLQQIVEFKNQTNIDLNKATQQLYDAAIKLDLDVQDDLEKTFDCFDKNLSVITTHLSGTIAEVDNATKRVPAVVNASYDGMEKSLKQMEENMEHLVNELNTLVNEIVQKQNS